MQRRIAILVCAATLLVGILGLSSTALAYPNRTTNCTSCHRAAADTVVKVTQTANDGVTATYSISVSSTGGGLVGWTVLSGSTNLANASASTGTFSVPVGKTYTVWGNDTNSGANSITISPTTPPPPPPPPSPPPSPDPTVTPSPDPTVTPPPPPPPSPDPTVTPSPSPDPTVTPLPDPTVTVDPEHESESGHHDIGHDFGGRHRHAQDDFDFGRWIHDEIARWTGARERD